MRDWVRKEIVYTLDLKNTTASQTLNKREGMCTNKANLQVSAVPRNLACSRAPCVICYLYHPGLPAVPVPSPHVPISRMPACRLEPDASQNPTGCDFASSRRSCRIRDVPRDERGPFHTRECDAFARDHLQCRRQPYKRPWCMAGFQMRAHS